MVYTLLILHIAKSAGIRKLFVGFCWYSFKTLFFTCLFNFVDWYCRRRQRRKIVFDFQIKVFELAVEHSCLLLEILYPMSVTFWALLTFLECIWVKNMLQAPLVSVIKDAEIRDAVNQQIQKSSDFLELVLTPSHHVSLHLGREYLLF